MHINSAAVSILSRVFTICIHFALLIAATDPVLFIYLPALIGKLISHLLSLHNLRLHCHLSALAAY